jgi:mRNA interferase HigB
MRLIGQDVINACIKQHSDSQSGLTPFIDVVNSANWKNIMDVREIYPHADVVGTCTVFNIKGNRYRLIAKIDYGAKTIYIKKVLTHAEYDKEKWKKDCGG